MLVDFFETGKNPGVAKQIVDAIKNDVEERRKRRRINLDKNWDMYVGAHAPYFVRRHGEEDAAFVNRKKNAIVHNLVGFTVDLAARYLYGKGSKVYRRYSENSDTQKKLYDLFKKLPNGVDSLYLEGSKKAAVFGEVVVRLVPVDLATGLQPDGNSTESTIPFPILLDTRKTWVKLNPWGRLKAVVTEYAYKDYGSNAEKVVTELVLDNERWMWVDDLNSESFYSQLSNNKFDVTHTENGIFGVKKNPYKLDHEFVYWKNNDEALSDIEGIMSLNIALDEGLTDKRAYFARHGWPQLVTDVDLSNVEYNPGKVWQLMGDVGGDTRPLKDHLMYLTWDGKMEDAKNYLSNLERMIMVLSNTAQISTGDLAAIGQLRSGAALITAHSVAIHKTEAKQIIWENNEKLFITAFSKMASYLKGVTFEAEFRDLSPIIKFPRDFVPGSEQERASIQKSQMDSHFVTIKDLIRQNNPDFSEEMVAAYKDEILKDAESLVDSTRKFVSEKETEGVSGTSGSSMKKSKEQSLKVS